MTEFGRVVATFVGPDPEPEALGRVWDNYWKSRAIAFPDWPGDPHIIANRNYDVFFGTVGWFADVPEEYVVTKASAPEPSSPLRDELIDAISAPLRGDRRAINDTLRDLLPVVEAAVTTARTEAEALNGSAQSLLTQLRQDNRTLRDEELRLLRRIEGLITDLAAARGEVERLTTENERLTELVREAASLMLDPDDTRYVLHRLENP